MREIVAGLLSGLVIAVAIAAAAPETRAQHAPVEASGTPSAAESAAGR